MTRSEVKKKVAGLFSPKPWKHGFQDILGLLDGEHRQKCICGMATDSHKTYTELSRQVVELRKTPCPIPDPIDIDDWNVAMKVFRGLNFYWAKDIELFPCFNEKLSYTRNEFVAKDWMVDEATPAQILEICVLAVEGKGD